ncbi:E3 ubiquitin-protein ligase TRIM71-like [Hydractinia symbiolongicarpus]|uniref:E3 ubiquitin-protein ligase TRIM71-like n=1 Tax=Hydractinia symbiolongicarpus TaxID=13093 RepID=UPI00254D16AA|nr:E3 ubiquitin-protein ligase TRIM71-like [Hydractinia symbiolongicarpus]XP_057317764.1 E3 ubiquitin-protein ligase TRIM71-like [Hydractinia symbiolongicarpus]
MAAHIDINTHTNVEHDHTKLKDIDLTCRICKRTFFHPRVLDCLHTFCEECIINNVAKIEHENTEKTYIKCFHCTEITQVPENDVSMLPYNFFANNAMDYLLIQCTKENAIICTSCSDDADAISRCMDCSEFLCMKCVTAHRRIRVTKDHKIIALDTLRYDKSSVHRNVYCPDHEPEVFTYYCEVCQDLICKECTILEHRGHKFERLTEALESQKPTILKLLEENEKQKVPPVERAVDEVQDMAARLHARTVATKQAIKNCGEQCIRAIEFRCQELLGTIDSIYKRKSRILHDQQKDLQLRLMKNKSATEFVNYAFKHGSEAEIFELLDVMKMRLTKLNLENLDYKEPDDNDVIDHVYDTDNVKNIAENLGKISTSTVFLSKTRLYGPGLNTGKVGIETFFVMEVFDHNGDPCIEHAHDESIRIKVQAPEGFYVNNKLHNNNDGTFVVRYTPVTKGKHDVTVKIRGRNFPNNHFVVRVYDGIDYLKIESPFLTFGSYGSKPSELKQPWGVAVNKDGHLYVTDHGNHRVQAYDKFGAFITEFGSKGTKDGQFTGPTGIAVDQSGIVFVADWENHRIQVFSADGTFLAKFGTKGSGVGQLYHPAGVAIDRNGYVVVAERDNHRLQVFTVDGKPILAIGSRGSDPGQLDSPTHLAVTEDNSYVVADAGNNRLICVDNGGIFVKEVGVKGTGSGEFNRPSGIAVDREGYVIVGDFHNHRIQILTPDLKYFGQFGTEGNKDTQFKHPSGVCLTDEGHVAVVDRYNHRVQIF